MRSCASRKRSRLVAGFIVKLWYSGPMPRTKPQMTLPPLMTSIIATSSATRSGWSRSGVALPRMAIFALCVRATRYEAMTSGEGMRP